MAELAIIGEKPMEGAPVLDQIDISRRFEESGFTGLRRVEILRFAKPFFITDANPNGTIEPFKDDMAKEKIVPMLDIYMAQGKFGADPFNLRPQDEMAAMRKRLAELEEKFAGPRANPEAAGYKPPQTGHVHESSGHVQEPTTTLAPDLTELDRELKIQFGHADLEKMPWRDLVAKAKGMGLKPYQKTRTILISEIEAKEAA